jgi:4'-phosphopantetheinyl transferase
VQGEPKSPVTGGAVSGDGAANPRIEVFFIDLVRAATFLEAEEARTPRLSGADIARAGAMADSEARHLWRASRIAARVALERIGGAGLRRVAFQIEPSGRPGLGEGGPYFSISHTGGVALVAIAKAMAVGVDLEAKDRTLRMSGDRRRRILSAIVRFGPQPPLSAEKDSDILVAWVQLEAAAKALGIGIGRLLTEEGVVGGVKVQRAEPQRELVVRPLPMKGDYVGGIAARHLPVDLSVKPLPYAKLSAFLRGEKE